MKKFISILLVAVLAITCVFAVDSTVNTTITNAKLSMDFGVTDEVAYRFHRGTFGLAKQEGYGLALNVRADFKIQPEGAVENDWYATMILGVSVPKNYSAKEKTDLLARYASVPTFNDTKVTHYLTFLLGGTKMFVKEKFDFYTTVGPEISFNLTTGNVDFAVAGAAKASFKINPTWSLDLNLKGGVKFVKEGMIITDWTEEEFKAAFTANQITFGATYSF